MVIERKSRLGEIIKTGTVIDSVPSMELIGNIFFHNSPLHDGAMILRDGKLYAAGCFLPLSDNYDISKQLGTRHRAALGMSENSDALVIVVSEENGVISVALEGKLTAATTRKCCVSFWKKRFCLKKRPKIKSQDFGGRLQNENSKIPSGFPLAKQYLF